MTWDGNAGGRRAEEGATMACQSLRQYAFEDTFQPLLCTRSYAPALLVVYHSSTSIAECKADKTTALLNLAIKVMTPDIDTEHILPKATPKHTKSETNLKAPFPNTTLKDTPSETNMKATFRNSTLKDTPSETNMKASFNNTTLKDMQSETNLKASFNNITLKDTPSETNLKASFNNTTLKDTPSETNLKASFNNTTLKDTPSETNLKATCQKATMKATPLLTSTKATITNMTIQDTTCATTLNATILNTLNKGIPNGTNIKATLRETTMKVTSIKWTTKTMLQSTVTAIFYSAILSTLMSSSHAYVTRIDQCEPIEIPRCRAMPYNMTQLPNLMHHNTQENARLVFQRFEILIDQHCSDVLLFLLCSIYVPICAVSLQPEAIPPCRSVCEKARAGCEPLMNAYKVPWPDSLDCSRLPRYERGVCVSPEAFVKPSKSTTGPACVCKARKPSYRIFKKYIYDYAIRAIILKKKNISPTEMVYRVKVTQILFSGKIKFPLNSDVILWVNSTCACPKLRKGKENLILGHEDSRGNKLMITPLSIAVQWRDSWAVRIKRWQDQIQSPPSDGKNRQPGRGRKKGKRRQKQKTTQPGINIKATTQSLTSQPSIEAGKPTLQDFVNGYTHGGRYYTDFRQKHSQSAPYPNVR